ncbi:hypothetical protein NA78x_005707 [Anatilimnocola sp. NA78]|uniref:hypothetical protein n=1 Tax=Anatilimnocola sp. NA78 TaxID=3415683 RepID=UPI003CE596ED
MFELLSYLLAPIAEFFAYLFQADDRREARQITIGCGIIVLAAIVVFVVWVNWQRG